MAGVLPLKNAVRITIVPTVSLALIIPAKWSLNAGMVKSNQDLAGSINVGQVPANASLVDLETGVPVMIPTNVLTTGAKRLAAA